MARGEHGAFDQVYEQLREPVQCQVRAILRDPAQSEEVTQEVLLELWRTAVRYDSDKGSATAWALTIARRRAIDRVRHAAASAARERRTAMPAASWDQTSEAVEDTLNCERLRRCVDQLSGLQQQASHSQLRVSSTASLVWSHEAAGMAVRGSRAAEAAACRTRSMARRRAIVSAHAVALPLSES